uniref:Angiomotin like 1 n=1 Tax=Latimeria chalumnae TaxID=7897 RepID=H3AZ50_LATCH
GSRPDIYHSLHNPFLILGDIGYLYQERNLHSSRHELLPVTADIAGNPEENTGEEPLCNLLPQNFLRASEVDMRCSEDVTAGTVLQRLIQEQLRYGNPNENMNLLAIQHQTTGSIGPSNSTTSTLSSTENLAQEDPQMVHQSARQEPQGQEHQVDNTVMEKQTRAAQSQQNNEDLPTYEEAKAQSQLLRGQQQGAIGPGFYVPVANQKARTEGRATVNRTNSAQAHKDEALKELKQGHVRSLSERIMQLSLERNGAKQHPPTSGSNIQPQPTNKGFKNGGPAPAQPMAKGMDPRGPPPEYPFKGKQVMSSVCKPLEHGPIYIDQYYGAMPDMTKPYPTPQPARTEVTVLRYQPPPEYGATSRQCQVSYQPVPVQEHSPMSSQASSVSSPLHSTSLPPLLGMMPPQHSPAASPNQQFPPFTIVEQAQHMVELLSEENCALRQELEGCYEKAAKLQKFEVEIQRISEAYGNLVNLTNKRESLEKTMKNKLEGEIRRLHDFNRDLRGLYPFFNSCVTVLEILGTGSRTSHLAQSPMSVNHSDRVCLVFLSPSLDKEHLKEKEKLEMELAALRSANEDQRRHIEILDQALNNAQAKVVKLEEEKKKKKKESEKSKSWWLTSLKEAANDTEQCYSKCRRLKRDLYLIFEGDVSCQKVGNPIDNDPNLLIFSIYGNRESYLALSKRIQCVSRLPFKDDVLHIVRDTTMINHSRNGSYSDSSLEARIWQEEEEIMQANRRCQDMEHRIKNLHAQIIEKDAMIKVLQQRSRKEPGKTDTTPLRPARSVPSISAATGLHSRQTSLTNNQTAEEKKEDKSWKGSVGLLLGKDNHESPLPSLLPPTSSALSLTMPSMPVITTHVKTGSKDSSTQTDKSPELLRPNAASVSGKGRLSTTPSRSPILRHTLGKASGEKQDISPILGKPRDSRGRAGNVFHKPDFPDGDVVEILI